MAFSVRGRLVVSLLLVVFGFVIVGGLAFSSLGALQDSALQVAELNSQQVRFSHIEGDIVQILTHLEDVQADPAQLTTLEAALDPLLAEIEIEFDEALRVDVADTHLTELYDEFLALSEQLDSRLMSATQADVPMFAQQSLADFRQLNDDLHHLENELDSAIIAENAEVDSRVDRARNQLLVALILLGLALTGLSLWNVTSITTGIETLAAGANRLAQTQVAEPIHFRANRKDEFTRLGNNFNQMAETIRNQRITLDNQLKDLEEARDVALRATERKTTFLSNMSHELRAPLHIILNFTRLMQEGEAGDLNDMQQNFTQRIIKSGEHLQAVINDVLDMERIEAGQLEIDINPLDLSLLLAEMPDSAASFIQRYDKNIQFMIHKPDDLPLVLGDETRVRQVLLNLIANAVRFTDEGEVRVTFGKGVKDLTICVEDTGIGIAPDKLRTIFDRFQQGGDKNRGGTGLGLNISRDLVRLHGGRIWVTSRLGEGSQFCFTLPLATEAIPEPKTD